MAHKKYKKMNDTGCKRKRKPKLEISSDVVVACTAIIAVTILAVVLISAFVNLTNNIVHQLRVTKVETYNRAYVCEIKQIDEDPARFLHSKQTNISCIDTDETFSIKNLHIPISVGQKIEITTHHSIAWDTDKGQTWQTAVNEREEKIKNDTREKNHEIENPKRDIKPVDPNRKTGLVTQT